MGQTTTTTIPFNPLRLLLAEASAMRLRGDHGAAVALELDALRVLRAACAEARQGVAQ